MKTTFLGHFGSQFSHNLLTVAQSVPNWDEDQQEVDLFFCPCEHPGTRSEILVADRGLSPPPTLLEDADDLTL